VAQDAEQIAAVTAYCDAAHPAYARRLSLFWGVIEDFADTDAVQIPGRFPALDRLDLIEHGRYVAGEELRAQLAPPSRAAVLENSRHDLPRFVRDPARYGFLTGGAELDTRERRAVTRFCLFPARFLHTAIPRAPARSSRIRMPPGHIVRRMRARGVLSSGLRLPCGMNRCVR